MIESEEEIETPQEGNPDIWTCAVCTLINVVDEIDCNACDSPRYPPPPQTVTEEELSRQRQNQIAKSGQNWESNYVQIMNLDDTAGFVTNSLPFECPICFLEIDSHEGVILRECLHTFCRTCLISTVEFSDDAEVKCPYKDENYSCESVLLHREIKALVPKTVFDKHLAKGITKVEGELRVIENAFHCKKADCVGWWLTDGTGPFSCPVCKRLNCLPCDAIHEGLDCKAYQEGLAISREANPDVKLTKVMLQSMVQRRDAMACPKCHVVIVKEGGCDGVQCSLCKTYLCWATRGARWGPLGHGDYSGGCRCGYNGVKCHPSCNNCH